MQTPMPSEAIAAGGPPVAGRLPIAVPTLAAPTLLQRVVHFGWLTILVGAIAMAATYPGRTHGLGMVTEPVRGS